jgi:polyphosphate glucokinase
VVQPTDRVLVLDVGGRNVKLRLMPDGPPRRKIPSGRTLSPTVMVEAVIAASGDLDYPRITIGFPGPVRDGRLLLEPKNLGSGWIDFDFAAAFGRPTRLVNDAAMQALGSYEGGKMLFLGLGTGLGAALVVDGVVLGLEVAHLPYRDGGTFEDLVGQRGLDALGLRKWRRRVLDAIGRLRAAVVADTVVLGGGNATLVGPLPDGVTLGANAKAFEGGYRLWAEDVRLL